jgi:hypothetical protein
MNIPTLIMKISALELLISVDDGTVASPELSAVEGGRVILSVRPMFESLLFDNSRRVAGLFSERREMPSGRTAASNLEDVQPILDCGGQQDRGCNGP